jgi:hypothetical protein
LSAGGVADVNCDLLGKFDVEIADRDFCAGRQ